VKTIIGILLSAVAAFLTGLLLFQFGMLAFVRSGAEMQVQDLVGMELTAARAALESDGFTGIVEREENSTDFGEGVVAEQRPPAGKVLRKGRKVWLTVSLGPRKTAVPSVVGMSYRQAGIVLAADELTPGAVSRIHHAGVDRGDVIAQSPPVGAPLAEGGRIDLLVSLGPPPEAYVMPDLGGRALRDARPLLTRHGLKVGERTVVIDRSVLPGTILEQKPPAGSRVEAGQEIDLVVSAGS
jgi:serine/threonine-protein kinase